MRCELENKYQIRVPLVVHLKGNTLRVGKIEDYQTKLKKGNTYRMFQSKKIIGNSKACHCDLGEHFNSLKKGDIVSIDYGKHSLRVIGKETMEKAIQEIGEDYCQNASVSRSKSRFKFNLAQSKWRHKAERKMSECIQEQVIVKEESESPTTPKKTNLKALSLFGQKNSANQLDDANSMKDNDEKAKEADLCSISHNPKETQSNSRGPRSFNNLDDSFSEVSYSPASNLSSFHLLSEKLQFRFKFESNQDIELKSKSVLVCEVIEDCFLRSYSAVTVRPEAQKLTHMSVNSKVISAMHTVLTKQDIGIIDRSLEMVA